MSEPSERAEIGRTPIAGDSPAGENLSAEAEYEALQTEATKDAGIHGPIDWEKVVAEGTEILRSRSKDFKVASWVAVGLTHLEQYQGLRDGLSIVIGMIEQHWDAAFPPAKRMRGRANAFSWMAERSAKVLERTEVQAADAEAIEQSYQSINDLGKLLEERLGDFDVQLGDLLRALREARERVQSMAPPPPPPPPAAAPTPDTAATPTAPEATPQGAAPAAAPQAAPPAPAAAASTPAAPGEVVSKSDAHQLIQRAATYFKEKEPASPVSYRLTRLVRWSEIAADPPSSAEGRIELVDPTPERVNGLRGLFDAANWTVLFPAAEEAFRERPLWLDVQRYSVEAARAQGAQLARVADAVVDELRSLLRRAPGLPKLCFRDGTPCADPDTRAWIEGEVLVAESGGPGPAVGGSGVDPAELERARQESRQLARKKRLGEGIAMLQDVTRADRTPRGRFLGRFEVAQLCADTGQDRMALAILEELDVELVRHGLEQWEPELAAEVLRSLYRCRRRMAERKGAAPEDAGRADEIFARLCQLDPSAAAALD